MRGLQWNSCPHFPSCTEENTNNNSGMKRAHLSCSLNNKAQPPTCLMLLCKEVNSSLRHQHHLWDDSKSASAYFIMFLGFLSPLSDYPENFNTGTEITDSVTHPHFSTVISKQCHSPQCSSIQSINITQLLPHLFWWHCAPTTLCLI